MRYERKFKTDAASHSAMQLITRLHPACFREAFPSRWVNNLYFDSPDFTAFNDNASGAPQRVKYRLRWYGRPFEQLHSPVLEVKWKEGEAGSKRSFPLGEGAFPISRLASLADAARQLLGRGRELQPVLFNSYHRAYLISADGKFRLTIDSGLRFGPYRTTGANFLPYALPGLVLEVKYAIEDEPDSDVIFQNLPFRRTKSSKYATGLELVYGG